MSQADTAKISILVVDDHALFRESLTRLLNSEPDFTVAAHCGSLEEALEIVANVHIDLVLLDLDLGDERGFTFLSAARERGYNGRVLVVTGDSHMPERDALHLISQGVSGIFLKDHPAATLSAAIRRVTAGEVWLERRYLEVLMRASLPSAEQSGAGRLSEREVQVLHGILEGLANKQIADRLQVSESSVKATLQQLFRKTGVRTRSQIVRIALEQYADQL